MAYVNRGSDARILGPIGGWIQSKLSFHSGTPPNVLKLPLPKNGHLAVTWPPFLSIFVPYGDRFASFRLGWRHDYAWRGYIFDGIVKLRIDHAVEP
jgi:hypothetical protein